MLGKGRCCIALLFVLGMSAASLLAAAFEPDETVVYKIAGKRELRLNIFKPEEHQAADRRSAIVFFSGGEGRYAAPGQFYPHCRYLASRGMVAISAEYRPAPGHGAAPLESVQDGKSAVRWVRKHADELGVNPNRIIAAGASLGGFVAAAAGSLDGFEEPDEDSSVSSRPSAVLLFDPVFGGEGPGGETAAGNWREMSPLGNIGRDTPPTLFFLGTRDGNVSPEMAQEYERSMKAAKRRCDLHLYHGRGRGFYNYSNRADYDAVIREIDHFLVALRYIEKREKTDQNSSYRVFSLEPLAPDAIVGPYLQNPAESSIVVCLVSKAVKSAVLELEGAPAGSQADFEAESTAIPNTEWTVWKMRLHDLEAGRDYGYRVKCLKNSGETEVRSGRFELKGSRGEGFRYMVFNDLHDNLQTMRGLVSHLETDRFDGSVLLGDCWNDPGDPDKVIALLNGYIDVLDGGSKPIFYARGNHECRGRLASRMGYLFDLPNLDASAPFADQNYYYGVRVGPAFLLFPDCGEDFTKKFDIMQPYRQRQVDWMRSWARRPEYRDAKWRIMLSHIPLYNDNIWNSEPSREFWEPLLPELDIDVAIAGHDHGYKFLEKGKTLKIERKNIRREMTPPFPVFIGGGPGVWSSTVILIEADSRNLAVRMISHRGTELASIEIAAGQQGRE